MLTHLRIVDFGIIDSVDLDLAPGLNVLTGETGAGKSMIVGAAGLLRGGRASSEIVRKGRDEAAVEALFDLRGVPAARDRLADLGLPQDGDELLVRRVVPRSGRGRIWVNGSLCSAAMLGRVMAGLVDISGQHEHQSLLDRKVQLGVVDALAVKPAQAGAMAKAYDRVKELADRLAKTHLDDRERATRTEFLRFQLRELGEAKLVAGEDEELMATITRLRRASDLVEVSTEAEAELYSADGSVCDRIGALQRRLTELQDVDPALAPFAGQLEEARVTLEDAALSLGRYAEGRDLDPAHLEALEARLDLLHRLRRKHGVSLSELVARTEEMRRELDELEGLDGRRDELGEALRVAREEAQGLASRLSTARRRVSGKLQVAISERLVALGMKGARFVVDVGAQPVREGDPEALVFSGAAPRRLGPRGWDRVEFLVATNAGEDARPVGRVASGGELSRLMLALRQVLGEHDPAGTSIFDEVDAGIGGAIADVVGRSLAAVGRHRQVLVVTHLPQVAAYAKRHFHVGKGARGKRTATTIHCLGEAERREELARMLAGSRVTQAARD
ncbi:MAG: DNA repair protein RecN, partial [Deltaproteobacteria bacterium]|nr:DNA repair protein RecN [Deltaproteobacteria bacterium]